MTAVAPTKTSPEIVYSSADGKPVAETYDHLYAILTTLEVLKQYLSDRQATVLANQFLYYVEGYPKLRVAPDVMAIFDVEPGGRDNYKIWEEGQVPAVIFEMTSKGTKNEDLESKKNLYEGLGVEEYWLFDPKGEWIPEKLRGYRLQEGSYERIVDSQSVPLQLRLAVEDKLIGFYRLESGEKLLVPDDLAQALRQKTQELLEALEQIERERQRAEQERQRASQLEAQLALYRERFGDLTE